MIEKSKQLTRKQKRLIFYILIVALPVLHFCIFYIYVRFNSIIMSIQKYTPLSTTGTGMAQSSGYMISYTLENFSVAFKTIIQNAYMIKNSLLVIILELLVGYSLGTVFSFYIYKKYVGSTIFKLVLFLPNIISGLIFSLLFKMMVSEGYMALSVGLMGTKPALGLLENPHTQLGVLIFYYIWLSFGVKVLMFSSAMSGIDESLVESAHLDGAGLIQEFFKITIPMIWPTLSTFIVLSVASLMTTQMNLYTMYELYAPEKAQTFGYYLYVQATASDVYVIPGNSIAGIPILNYPQLSAIGLILTLVMLPITLLLRKGLNKFGPSVE